MRYQEQRIDLEFQFDLKEKMPCPSCNEELEQPNYECDRCGKTLVFFVKQ